jgi:hypothetical protein
MLGELCEGKDMQIMLPVITKFKGFLKSQTKALCCWNNEKVSDRINCIILSVLHLMTLCLTQTAERLVVTRINKF